MTQEKIIMPRDLTAEIGAKYAMSGKFNVDFEIWSEEIDDYVTLRQVIPWSTIKDIYAKAVEIYGQPLPSTEGLD